MNVFWSVASWIFCIIACTIIVQVRGCFRYSFWSGIASTTGCTKLIKYDDKKYDDGWGIIKYDDKKILR